MRVTGRNSTVIFTSVVSGLTSIILIVLGPVNFQFRGVPVPTSLWSILRTVAAQVLGMDIMRLTLPPGVSVSIRQLTGYGSEYSL